MPWTHLGSCVKLCFPFLIQVTRAAIICRAIATLVHALYPVWLQGSWIYQTQKLRLGRKKKKKLSKVKNLLCPHSNSRTRFWDPMTLVSQIFWNELSVCEHSTDILEGILIQNFIFISGYWMQEKHTRSMSSNGFGICFREYSLP